MRWKMKFQFQLSFSVMFDCNSSWLLLQIKWLTKIKKYLWKWFLFFSFVFLEKILTLENFNFYLFNCDLKICWYCMKSYRKLILNYRKIAWVKTFIHTFRCYCKLKTGNELLLVFYNFETSFENLTAFKDLNFVFLDFF